MDETKTEAIRVRLDPALYAKFSRFCKKNKMSQSNVIRMALRELLNYDEQGKFWDEDNTKYFREQLVDDWKFSEHNKD